MKPCITTTVSANHYQAFVPLFVYSAHRAYPDAGIVIFAEKGHSLHDIPHAKIVTIPHPKHRERKSIFNCLRFLHDPKHFSKYTHVYYTDADFILFAHTPSHFDYYRRIMQKTNLPYAAARGPYGALRRRYGQDPAWKTKCRRMAAGAVYVECDRWFPQTARARQYYSKILSSTKTDDLGFPPAKDREYDEVMLYQLCLRSGLSVPTKKNCFANGDKANTTYRDIHIGDFKFTRRDKESKMARILRTENVKAFLALEQDECWQKVCSRCEDDTVNRLLKKLRAHIKKRA